MSSPVVSYDVFDTALTRLFAHPRDLFVGVGVELQRTGLSSLEPRAFAAARWAAELSARRKCPWVEVLHADIYRELAAQLGWTDATADAARNCELQLEDRCIRPVPLMAERLAAARARAGRIVFLSDMYLPSAVIRSWLERHALATPADLVLVSGEARANKSSGRLFETARTTTGGAFNAWDHTGDHAFADVAKPASLGIRSHAFTRVHLTPRERAIRATTGEFTAPWRSVLAGAMRLARLEREPATERERVLWETGTTVAGPLFYGFVRWTLAQAEQRGLQRLHFLARDGQILHRVAQAILQQQPRPLECRYLRGSRLLFTGAAEWASPAAMRELLAPRAVFHSRTIALAALGLDEAWAQAHLPAALRAAPADANLALAERDALADFLLAPAQRDAVAASLAQRADRARAYLAAEGLTPGEPVGLVDVGWFGSIQRNLESLLDPAGARVPLTAFYIGLMANTPAFAGEAVGYANAFAPLPLLREESHKVLIELMAQADHGQACGLVERDGRMHVVERDPGPVDLAAIRTFQEAVLTFVRHALDAEEVAPVADADYAPVVLGNYRALHDRPTAAEARVLGALPHADQLFEQNHAGLCAPMDFNATLAAVLDHQKRPPHWWVQGQSALGHGALLRSWHFLKRTKWRLSGRPA